MKLSDEQRDFIESGNDYCAFIGAHSSGKTTAIAHRALHIDSQNNDNESIIVATPNVREKKDIEEIIATVDNRSRNNITTITAMQLNYNNIQGREHILVNYFQSFDTSIREEICDNIGTFDSVNISSGPISISNMKKLPDHFKLYFSQTASRPVSKFNSSKKTTMIGSPSFKFTNVSNHRLTETDTKMYCMDCGESETFKPENPIDRLVAYNSFQKCDCN